MKFLRSSARAWSFVALLLPFSGQASAQDEAGLVSQTWQMLDYLATDYAGAVQDGKVVSESEYAEMQEFSATVYTQLEALPDHPGKGSLVAQASDLATLIADRSDAHRVASQAHQLADGLLANYPIPTSPAAPPDLGHGGRLYAQYCASCHGVAGDGKGPAALGLDPAPIDFTDSSRADQRSPLSLYQTITQGVEGTAMTGYGQLPGPERWALAYHVGTLAYADKIGTGAEIWRTDPGARASIGTLDELSRTRAEQLAPRLGVQGARGLIGYLRSNPAALEQAPSGIALARARLAASLQAYRAGDLEGARALALSAYLDGVEPVEPLLDAHDGALRSRIELAMGAYRSSLTKGDQDQAIGDQASEIDRLLSEAQALTSSAAASAATSFIGAFTILVREGLEALLVVVALIAFLKKAGRPETLRYVHAGWALALLAGILTWLAARSVIDISGASRELTEGLASLVAVVVLLGLGLWMHQKSIGERWQTYIKGKMGQALNRRSSWLLFTLAFVAVYREVFEIILFYVALWQDGQGWWMLGGIAGALVVLALITWALLGASRRLPIAGFFRASSALIALLAIVLTGRGVAALQEAGWVGVSLARLPHIELLGLYPTWETSLAQLLILALLASGFLYNRRQALQIA